MVTTGFLRAGSDPLALPRSEPGPALTFEESDAVGHRFFELLAGDRELATHKDDPVEHVRENGLMILFSADAAEAFETWLVRMPPPRQEAWRDLIAGGARSEAFGPLTLQERLDERQVETAMVMGRRQRLINLSVAVLALVGLGVGCWWAWNTFIADESRQRGALQFADLGSDPASAATEGGPPVAEPLLTATLSDTIGVVAGDGEQSGRVVDPAFTAFVPPAGSLRASLFEYAGAGHVVIVGPAGFVESACLRASVVTADLRPLDTVTHGPCADPVGRTPAVGCVGSTALLLHLRVPPGEVALPEGGTGFADAVRVQMVVDGNPDYELLSARATIAVDSEVDVVVPRFGGAVGDELTFDLGAGRSGTCSLTGDLPAG